MNAMIYVAFGFVGLLAVALVAALMKITQINARLNAEETARGHSAAQFELVAQQALRNAQDSFLQMAETKLKDAHKDSAHDLEKRQTAISALVDPIGKTLKEMEAKIENLGKTGSGLESQLKTFSEIQNRLHAETTNLSRALRNPGQGGRWGEMHLQRTLEFMGMVENTHFRRQVYTSVEGESQKPDFILEMPNGLQIVVDVKTQMDPYLELTSGDLTDEQRTHIIDLVTTPVLRERFAFFFFARQIARTADAVFDVLALRRDQGGQPVFIRDTRPAARGLVILFRLFPKRLVFHFHQLFADIADRTFV